MNEPVRVLVKRDELTLEGSLTARRVKIHFRVVSKGGGDWSRARVYDRALETHASRSRGVRPGHSRISCLNRRLETGGRFEKTLFRVLERHRAVASAVRRVAGIKQFFVAVEREEWKWDAGAGTLQSRACFFCTGTPLRIVLDSAEIKRGLMGLWLTDVDGSVDHVRSLFVPKTSYPTLGDTRNDLEMMMMIPARRSLVEKDAHLEILSAFYIGSTRSATSTTR